MVATIAVSLTFIIIFACFSFVTPGGIGSLLQNNNLFFHLIIPVTSIVTFLFFEKTDVIKFDHTVYGLLPTALYEVYYTSVALSNMKNGEVPITYDWYYFLQNGKLIAIAISVFMLVVTYIITLVIWRLNRVKIKSNK